MANRLQHELSPYLLQHAQNPVDWYPWGPATIERARNENLPVFLSIGYSACHWCHVMEHESFENDEIAAQLNRDFVCIKVDREERPDLDQIYMTAVQILTGRGGWPMSVFLTPALEPFFGGTYWPPHPRRGMPGFDQVLAAVLDAWNNRRETAISQARQLTERIEHSGFAMADDPTLNADVLENASRQLAGAFDPTHGGFGNAPKFPHATDIQLLLRNWQRWSRDEDLQMVNLTLDRMATGGIYDHLGGGFARYSVDGRWLVPHFEKMLYDNALLSATYLDSYLATGNLSHRRVVEETLDYVLRDMTDDAGGFHSTEDADSEGEEGKYYVWTPDEVREHLDAKVAERFCELYDVTPAGNFEGQNILNLPRSAAELAERRGWSLDELTQQIESARRTLLNVRQQRVRPAKDDKVIVAWNGLMIDSLARAVRALHEPRYQQAAARAAEFIRDQLWRDGRLLHSWRRGQATLPAYLDDYAALANALVSLYEASGNVDWVQWAFELTDVVLDRFSDPTGSAFYYTADDHERLIARTKDLQDSSVPSGNSLLATALIRLGHLGQRDDYFAAAESIMEAASGLMQEAPTAAGQMLLAADLWIGPFHQVVLVGDANADAAKTALRDFNGRYLPRTALVIESTGARSSQLAPLLKDRTTVDDEPTVYVCEGQTCQAPISVRDVAAVQALWTGLR